MKEYCQHYPKSRSNSFMTFNLAGPARLELATPWLTVRSANQLRPRTQFGVVVGLEPTGQSFCFTSAKVPVLPGVCPGRLGPDDWPTLMKVQEKSCSIFSLLSIQLFVGAAGFEPAMFTRREQFYRLLEHHRRSCTPKFLVPQEGVEPSESCS